MAPAFPARHASPGARRSRPSHAQACEAVTQEPPEGSRRAALATERHEAENTPVLRSRVPTFIAAIAAFLAGAGLRGLAKDLRAEGEIIKFGLIGSLVGVIVILLLLAKFIPKMFQSNAKVVSTIEDNNTTTGDKDVDDLKPTFGFLMAIAFILAIVSLVLGVYTFKS